MDVRARRMCLILWNLDQAMASLLEISLSVLSVRANWRPRMIMPWSLCCLPGRHLAALWGRG